MEPPINEPVRRLECLDVQVVGLPTLKTQSAGFAVELAILGEPLLHVLRLGQNAPHVVDGRLDEDLLLDLAWDHFAE